MPFEVLEDELCEVPPAELKVFLSAVTKGELRTRNKALAVLGYLRGIACGSICPFLNVSAASIFNWLREFREGGAVALFTRKPRSDIKANQDTVRQAVFALLHSPPTSHGFNRTTWTLENLKVVLSQQLGCPLSCDVIRKIIKDSGWKWRHARVVLTSNDPDYRAKVEAIKEILSELREDEAFFSIDEFGPFAIKRKGGVKRVPPGEQYVVPQWQKSKGWLILTAALELSKNQVIHFYSQ
jgi:transposase